MARPLVVEESIVPVDDILFKSISSNFQLAKVDGEGGPGGKWQRLLTVSNTYGLTVFADTAGEMSLPPHFRRIHPSIAVLNSILPIPLTLLLSPLQASMSVRRRVFSMWQSREGTSPLLRTHKWP